MIVAPLGPVSVRLRGEHGDLLRPVVLGIAAALGLALGLTGDVIAFGVVPGLAWIAVGCLVIEGRRA